MPKPLKVPRLFAQSVPLELKVENLHPLKLKLAWTMRGLIFLEQRLRSFNIPVNLLQNPSVFWNQMDCAMLTSGVWAMAQQEQPEFAGEDGFDAIASYIVPENYAAAAKALQDCFLESLSQEDRDKIKKAEQKAAEAKERGEEVPVAEENPTPAPALT